MPTREEILHFDEDGVPPGADPWVVKPTHAPIEIIEYNPAWPEQAREIRERLSAALGVRAIRIEHVGSTAVVGLPAKPIIDIDLTVADPDNEDGWLPALVAAGLVLTVREPWWHGHRMLRSGHRADDPLSPSEGGPAANVHVFGPDSPELVKHIVFRNWLRADRADRELYADAKRAAAASSNTNRELVEDYNARKQAVIVEIYGRAFRASGFLE